jgi:uncharacterized protein (DUF362 family)
VNKPVVSIVKFDDAYRSTKRALELCDGLKEFRTTDRIVIKPNLVFWDFDLPFPPFGVVTTSVVMFALVRLLYEEGYRHLIIGEAPLPVPRSRGREIFKALGYEELRERYGVELVDFNEERFEPVDFGDFQLAIARRALEADKIINVPVLKTHGQCKVSLGLKNLKGCLDRKSKMLCHNPEGNLEQMFPQIVEKLPVALTIIDGVFTLEKGPGATGRAYRKDLLIASRDPFSCDAIGAALMGYAVEEVPHLEFFARRHGRATDLSDVEVRGENIEKHRAYVNYDWEWTEDNSGPIGFQKRGIKGLVVRKYDETLCTGCTTAYNPMLVMLMGAFKGEPFPGIEVVSGKKQLASAGFEKTILFGKCACELNKKNPNIKHAIALRGCPPDLRKFEKMMREEGIDCSYEDYVNYRHHIFNRYKVEEGFDIALYRATQ